MKSKEQPAPLTERHIPWLIALVTLGLVESVIAFFGVFVYVFWGSFPRWSQWPATFRILKKGFGISRENEEEVS